MSNYYRVLKSFQWHNFSWQSANYGISGIAMLVMYVLIARYWRVSEFGDFSTIMVWLSIYSLITDLGLDFWVTKQTSLNRHTAYAKRLVLFKLSTAIAFALIITLFAYLHKLPFIPFMIFISGCLLLNVVHFFACFLRGIERLDVEAKTTLLRMVIFIVGSIVGVQLGFSLTWVAMCYLISNIIMAYFILVALKKENFSIVKGNLNIITPLKVCFHVWVCTLFIGLIAKIQIVLLGMLTNSEQVGLFTVSARFFEGGQLLATAFVLTIFPNLVSKFKYERCHFFDYVYAYGKMLVTIVIGAVIAGIFFGQHYFVVLFGQAYQQSLALFIWMMILLPFSTLFILLYQSLVIAGQTKKVISFLFISFTFSTVGSYFLILFFQLDGAILSLAVSEAFMLLGALWLCYRLNCVYKVEKNIKC